MPAPFTPRERHAGALMLFLLMHAHQPERGLGCMVATGDDFDDLLALIPEDCAGWHVLSAPIGRLVGGSESGTATQPGRDRQYPTVSHVPAPSDEEPLDARSPRGRPLARFVGFGAAGDGWGAWTVIGTSDDPEALVEAGAVALFDRVTSRIFHGGSLVGVVPHFEDIEAHQSAIAAAQLEALARGNSTEPGEVVEPAVGDALPESALPADWSNLPTDKLREVVEAAERAVKGRVSG